VWMTSVPSSLPSSSRCFSSTFFICVGKAREKRQTEQTRHWDSL
jgi:hypothetical protein